MQASTQHFSVKAILSTLQFLVNFPQAGRALPKDMHQQTIQAQRAANWSLASKCRGGGSH